MYTHTYIYRILGQGVPEGETYYVLTVEDGNYFLWNSVTGERFLSTETFCPLQSVTAVINETNVWGNVQPIDSPARYISNLPCEIFFQDSLRNTNFFFRIRWDFNSTSDWFPLFGRGGFNHPESGSIQQQPLSMSPPDKQYAGTLKQKIFNVLK